MATTRARKVKLAKKTKQKTRMKKLRRRAGETLVARSSPSSRSKSTSCPLRFEGQSKVECVVVLRVLRPVVEKQLRKRPLPGRTKEDRLAFSKASCRSSSRPSKKQPAKGDAE